MLNGQAHITLMPKGNDLLKQIAALEPEGSRKPAASTVES